MTNKRKALGRGLSALISTPAVSIDKEGEIPESARKSESIRKSGTVDPQPKKPVQRMSSSSTVENQVIFIETDKLVRNEAQPRSEFKETELRELSDSIKSLGFIQPILVRPNAEDKTKYQIVAGERRWRAAKLAKIAQVPVIIRDLEDKETLELALVENVQRENLNAIEEARAYQALLEDFSISQEELAKRVGKNRSTIANYVRVLRLPNEVIDMIANEQISLGHAKSILSVKEPAAQINLAKKVAKEKLSVRDLEDIVGRVVLIKGKSKKKAKKSAFPEFEEELKKALGTKVQIRHQNGKGKIEINYYSEEELERIVEEILG